jgi:protein-S-isoprenylcysteine O-methyltransferase Ste14
MPKQPLQIGKLRIKLLLFLFLSLICIILMLFLPAGTLKYWHAWLFIATLFIPVLFVMSYFLKHDPELLERRMRFKEKVKEQKIIIKLANLLFFIGFLIPGFDHRYGWSYIPYYVVVISDITILLGYLLIYFVFKENSYTSRIIEVEKKQKLISSGPYSIIRHPMYIGIILIYIAMPLALGSYWALIPIIPIIALIIFRTLNEEKVLCKDLKGYEEYARKVKYRLIPRIW